MRFTDSFLTYSWLNESQKKKLQAVYNTVQNKDIVDQAFDNLEFNRFVDGSGRAVKFSPMSYLFSLRTVLQACNRIDFLELVGNNQAEQEEVRRHLERLYDFFRVLDSESFSTLSAIEEAAELEELQPGTIDRLYSETKAKYLEKLEAMEV